MDCHRSGSHQNKSQEHLPLGTVHNLSGSSSDKANKNTILRHSERGNIPHHRFYNEDIFISNEDIFLSSMSEFQK